MATQLQHSLLRPPGGASGWCSRSRSCARPLCRVPRPGLRSGAAAPGSVGVAASPPGTDSGQEATSATDSAENDTAGLYKHQNVGGGRQPFDLGEMPFREGIGSKRLLREVTVISK